MLHQSFPDSQIALTLFFISNSKLHAPYLSHMYMSNTIIILCAVIALLIAGFAGYLFWAKKKFEELEDLKMKSSEVIARKIAAYERLTLFAERTKLESLISRLYQPGYDAATMRSLFLNSIKDEFEHNVVQQLYVDAAIWDALTRMKDQNIFIINQMASIMPANTPAAELNKRLLEIVTANPDSTMNNLLLQAIQFEVKKLMG